MVTRMGRVAAALALGAALAGCGSAGFHAPNAAAPKAPVVARSTSTTSPPETTPATVPITDDRFFPADADCGGVFDAVAVFFNLNVSSPQMEAVLAVLEKSPDVVLLGYVDQGEANSEAAQDLKSQTSGVPNFPTSYRMFVQRPAVAALMATAGQMGGVIHVDDTDHSSTGWAAGKGPRFIGDPYFERPPAATSCHFAQSTIPLS